MPSRVFPYLLALVRYVQANCEAGQDRAPSEKVCQRYESDITRLSPCGTISTDTDSSVNLLALLRTDCWYWRFRWGQEVPLGKTTPQISIVCLECSFIFTDYFASEFLHEFESEFHSEKSMFVGSIGSTVPCTFRRGAPVKLPVGLSTFENSKFLLSRRKYRLQLSDVPR